jgi:hypothetical protein
MTKRPDPLKPSVSLLSKLGSIVVHADEATSAGRHEFDIVAIKSLLDNPEVKEWITAMGVFMPVKRSK